MRTLFKKLPGFKIQEPGFEARILQHIFGIFITGAACISLPSILVRFLPHEGIQSSPEMINIFTIASLIIYALAISTIGIGALIVKMMKGPAYVADAYYLDDLDI